MKYMLRTEVCFKEDNKSHNRQSRSEVTVKSNLGIVVKSGGIGFIVPIVLGVFYGVLFLDNWNVWPAFIVAGSIFGLIIGVIAGIFLAIFRK